VSWFEKHFKEEREVKKLTIIALVVAVSAVFAVTATAYEWSLYGSVRMATFYTSQDLGKELELVPGTNTIIAVDARNSANQSTVKDLMNWNLQGNSRIGATVTGDRLEAGVEFLVTSNGAGGNVGSRRLYATWKFADGWGVKVGKDYTPITFFLSNQVFDNDSDLQYLGNAYGGRQGQIAVEGELGPGTLKVALIDQTTDTLNTPDGVVEKLLPKFEASYEYKFTDAMSAHAFGGYQTYSVKYPRTFGGTSDFSVDSWVVGAGGDLNFGPFYVKPQVSYYQNGAAAGWLNDDYLPSTKQGAIADFNDQFGTDIQFFGSNDAINAKNLMAMLALGFKPTESLGLEFGVGYVGLETDSFEGIKIKNNYFEYYLQAVFTMAKGVYIIPEIGYRDFGTEKIDKPFTAG
jgi:hypothetical protein